MIILGFKNNHHGDNLSYTLTDDYKLTDLALSIRCGADNALPRMVATKNQKSFILFAIFRTP